MRKSAQKSFMVKQEAEGAVPASTSSSKRSSINTASSRKRPLSTLSTASTSSGKLDLAAKCRICLQVFQEPFSTACGHTFCRDCITRHLRIDTRCPVCEMTHDPKKAKIIPNYAAADLVKNLVGRRLRSTAVSSPQPGELDTDEKMLAMLNSSDMLTIQRLSTVLKRRQNELELNDEQLGSILLQDFLDKMIEKRERLMQQTQLQIERLKRDRQKVATILKSQLNRTTQQDQQHPAHCLVPDSHCSSAQVVEDISYPNVEFPPPSSISSSSCSPPSADDHFGGGVRVAPNFADSSLKLPESMAKYRGRLNKHMRSLESTYFNIHQQSLADPDTTANVTDRLETGDVHSQLLGSSVGDDLEDFSWVIRGMSRYGDMKRLATLSYNVEASSALSIVSSIEFDKDGEFFVIAGVTKMIKVYDYEAVIRQQSDAHYPVMQLNCNSKISNVSWNPYNKSLLASSDYDGTVQLWDTNIGKATRTLKEHEKRCWTVQFNNVDPHLMASGSDDAKVKLWSVTAPQSIGTIDAKVNVCCVYFSPKSKNHLVFGSADHCVHLYDIRNSSRALSVFRGHRKAVSYVKYANEAEVVSASTDSNLRLWSVDSGQCLQTMRGHQNEKNFVGLATDGNHVVCGSENNHLYLYYKGIAEPLMSFDFGSRTVDSVVGAGKLFADSAMDASRGNEQQPVPTQGGGTSDFVSAVCWKKNRNVIVAANSQGTTHILQLQ